MRPRTLSTISLLTAFFLCTSCGAPTKESPEAFAMHAANLVGKRDFSAYQQVALGQSELLAAASQLSGTALGATANTLAPHDRERIRREFDAAVQTRRLEHLDFAAHNAVALPRSEDSWDVRLMDENDMPIGVDMQVRRWHEGFRIVALHVTPPRGQRAARR